MMIIRTGACILLLFLLHHSALSQSFDVTQRSPIVVNLQARLGKRSVVLDWSMEPRDENAIFEVWKKGDDDTGFIRLASGLTLRCYKVRHLGGGRTRLGVWWENQTGVTGQSNIIDVRLPPRNPLVFLVPGMYQLRSQQTAKGAILMPLSLLSLGASGALAYGTCYYHEKSVRYSDRFSARLQTRSSAPLSETYQKWSDAYENERKVRTAGYAAFGLSAGLVLFHLVDIVLYPREGSCRPTTADATRNRSLRSAVSFDWAETGPGARARIEF